MRRLLLAAISLWAVWAVRAHAILSLPAFVDESLHILRAQVVFQFSDAVASFLPGKLLLYYYFGLFQPQNHNGLWLTREATALLAPLAAALCFTIAKHFTRLFWASLVVIWVYALTPLMVFFERMALADTFALVFGLGVVWSSLLLAKKTTPRRAAATGILLGLALLAKLTALPFVAVPPLAVGLFSRANTINRVPTGIPLKIWAVLYGAAGLLLLLPLLYVIYQEAAQLENKQEVVAATLFVPQERGRLQQIGFNLETFGKALIKQLGIWALILVAGGLASLIRQPRPSLYLLAVLGMSWGFILVTSAFPSTRYLTISFPLMLIWIGIGLGKMDAIWRRRTWMLPLLVLVGLWAVIASSRFIANAWQSPEKLSLGEQDTWEYFSHTSSGYALREIAAYLATAESPHQPIRILSFAGSCHSIRFYFSAGYDVRLRCPYFGFYGNPILAAPAQWTQELAQADHFYVIQEKTSSLDFVSPRIPIRSLGLYPRPHDGEPARLFRVDFERRGKND